MEITSQTESQNKSSKNAANSRAINDDILNNNTNNKRIQKSNINIQFENNNINSNSNNAKMNSIQKFVKKQTVSVKSIANMNNNQLSSTSYLSSSDQQNATKTRTKSLNISESTNVKSYLKNLDNPITTTTTTAIDENDLFNNVNLIRPSEVISFENSNLIKLLTKSNASDYSSKAVNSSQSSTKIQNLSDLILDMNENNGNRNSENNNKTKFENDLEENFIFRVKKDIKQIDQPKYQCEICSYYCNTADIVTKHISSANHKTNLESMQIEMRIRELEVPSDSKTSSLSAYLIDFYLKNVISQENLNKRFQIFNKFKQKFLEKYPDAKVNLYGSSKYGICFDDSQVDVDIEFVKSNCQSTSQILTAVADFLKDEMPDTFELETSSQNKSKSSSNNVNNLNKISYLTKIDQISFNFTSGLFSSAFKTSFLIKSYLELDERARVLAFFLRYIAKIALIDKMDLCTLPPHSYILMTIHFLQQLNPQVLPVLHETISSSRNPNNVDIHAISKNFANEEKLDCNQENSSSESDQNENDLLQFRNFDTFKNNVQAYINEKHWICNNKENIGSLWLKLLAFYSIDFGFKKNFISVRTQRRMPKLDVKMYTKKLSIEDPFLLKQSLSRNLLTRTNKYIIFVLSKTCLYFVNTLKSVPESLDEKFFPNKNEKIVTKLIEETQIFEARKKNTEFSTNEPIVDEFNEDNEENDENDYENDDDIEFEDEDENYLNADQENNDELFDLFKRKSKNSYHSKSSRNSKSSESDSNHLIYRNREKIKFEKKLSDNIDKILKLDFKECTADDTNLSTTSSLSSPDNLTPLIQEDIVTIVNDCLKEIINNVVKLHYDLFEQMPCINLNELSISDSYNLDLFSVFKMNSTSLGIEKYPPKMCSFCNKEGHLDKECPQDSLPKLEALPEMTDNWRSILDKITLQIMEDNQQTKKEETDRIHLLDKIKSIVYKKFPEASLSLFGSSNNGFGMKKSDLDICMTLDNNLGNEDKITVNFKRIIRVIGSLFRADHEFDMVEERTSAKVPIVKFRHKKTNVEGDISLYNTLALQNTELIRSYAMIDERTKILGHVVKHFAKICNIGDASCGSLSSYAYIVMAVHYLMNTTPPVLPCLQKLNRDNLPKKETNLKIDGWDCWFNRDISNLENLWPHYKKNQQSIGELWLGFLCYYTEQFDWNNNVVCIRENDVLTRRSKNWTKHRLAIEDPFELSHNLAAGVSHKMGIYILKSFAKARSIFGNIINGLRVDEVRLNMDYFFNPKSLVDGPPPIGRNCFTCNKIGHQTRECPVALNMKKARQNEKKLKSENRNRFLSENNDDFVNTIMCYKCRNIGHIARDCPAMTQINNSNNNSTDQRCFTCNQSGHFSRDCIKSKLQRQHQMQQQQQIVKQQSAPQPKMIRVLSSSNPSASQQNKTNENNFQLSFNNNEQQNVFSNYQNFFLNRDQHIYSNQSNSANSNAYTYKNETKNEELNSFNQLNSYQYTNNNANTNNFYQNNNQNSNNYQYQYNFQKNGKNEISTEKSNFSKNNYNKNS